MGGGGPHLDVVQKRGIGDRLWLLKLYTCQKIRDVSYSSFAVTVLSCRQQT
jgi:hypothetical protein